MFGWAYIRVEKHITNLGGLYLGELKHGGVGGGLFTEFYGIHNQQEFYNSDLTTIWVSSLSG